MDQDPPTAPTAVNTSNVLAPEVQEPVAELPVLPHRRDDGGYFATDRWIRYGVDADNAEANDKRRLPIPVSIASSRSTLIEQSAKSPVPTNQLEVIWYLRYLRDPAFALRCGVPRGKLWRFHHMLAEQMRRISRIPLSERTEWQRCLAENWFIADFVREAALEKGAKEAFTHDNANVDTDMAPPSAPKRKNKGKGKALAPMPVMVADPDGPPSTLTATAVRNPTRNSSPEEWAAYLASSSGANTPLAGVFRRPDRSISMRSLRGRVLVTARRPNMPPTTPPHVAARYALLAAEVILRPNYYRDLVTNGQITIAGTAVPPTPFTEYLNATLVDVARFFAEQGLTVADIEDAAFYAANWLYEYAPNNSDVVLAANAVRDSFTSEVRLPLGYNEDYWVPGVGVSPHPPQALNVRIHRRAANTAASSRTRRAPVPRPDTSTTTSLDYDAAPYAAPSQTGPVAPTTAPVPTIAASSEAANTSAEAVQQMDET
jgi:hypothetical protein